MAEDTMTDTKPAPSLADVIRDAEYQWKDLHLAGMAGYNALPRGSRVDHIAAAVAAHLASPEVIERMVIVACNTSVPGDSCSYPTCGCTDGGMSAAVAAVVGGGWQCRGSLSTMRIAN